MRFTASLKYLLAFRSPLCPPARSAAAHVAATTARAEKEVADGRFQKTIDFFFLIDWIQFK